MSKPVAGAPSNEEVEELREVFACFDKDASGAVTTAELALVLKSMNKHYTEAELQKIVRKFDVNGQRRMVGDGQIDFDEFQTMMKKHHVKEADELKQAFDVFDKDGQNKKAKRIWDENTKLGMKYKGLLIRSRDKSGFIDFNEFRQMMKEGPVDRD